MMSFMTKKKRYKFNVTFGLEELTSVPFLSGMLFAKVRLLDGGNFCETSTREEIQNHKVVWKTRYSFQCKMTASASTGFLDPCTCRVSVRMEQKGGKAYQKLGFVDVNLSEFAGSGIQRRKYLLEGYDTKHRQDNSIIEVSLDLTLISGDPVFKVPRQVTKWYDSEDQPTVRVEESEGSLSPHSSGCGTLPRKDHHIVHHTNSGDIEMNPTNGEVEGLKGHHRNDSYTSQQSRGSTGYVSLTHSRQSSVGSEKNPVSSHTRNPSAGSALLNDLTKGDRRKKIDDTEKGRRVDQTRVDADDVVDDLFKEFMDSTEMDFSQPEESKGLQLGINKDGTAYVR